MAAIAAAMSMILSSHAFYDGAIVPSVALFSLAPILFASMLVYAALRSVVITINHNLIQFHYGICGLPLATRRLKLDKINLVGQWVGVRYRKRLLAIYGERQSKKVFIANEHSCTDIIGLFQWLENNSDINSKDCRHRTIAG